MSKRIILNQCCGVIINVQEFYLAQLEPGRRAQVEMNAMGLAKMLKYLRTPLIDTIERPAERKGGLPEGVQRYVAGFDGAEIFESDYFDLTKHKEITGYLRSIKKKQAIIGGGETDVSLLQSGLGLMHLGYDVFLIE